MAEEDSLKDWTKLELFYKLDGIDLSLLFKVTRPNAGEFVYPCKLIEAGTVCDDGVIRFDYKKLVNLLGIALPRMFVGLLETTEQTQEGFDG